MPKTEVHSMSGGHFDIDMVTDVRMYINCSRCRHHWSCACTVNCNSVHSGRILVFAFLDGIQDRCICEDV